MVSVFSEEAFNEGSHFMESNPLVQKIMQPILMFAVIFHFVNSTGMAIYVSSTGL